MKYPFLVVLQFVFMSIACFSQNVANSPNNCEINSLKLDLIKSQLLQQDEKKLVVIVARLGDGETASKLNIRRLYTIKTYLKSIGVPQNRIVTAEGESIKGFGSIEIFLNGELSDRITVGKCKDIPVGICDDDQSDSRKYQLSQDKIKCN